MDRMEDRSVGVGREMCGGRRKMEEGARKQPRGIKATRFTPVEGPFEHDPVGNG